MYVSPDCSSISRQRHSRSRAQCSAPFGELECESTPCTAGDAPFNLMGGSFPSRFSVRPARVGRAFGPPFWLGIDLAELDGHRRFFAPRIRLRSPLPVAVPRGAKWP